MYGAQTIGDYFREILEKIQKIILQESDNVILGSDLQKLIDYYLQDYLLQPIEFDETQESSFSRKKYVRDVTEDDYRRDVFSRGDFYQERKEFEFESLCIEYPIKFNESIDKIKSLQTNPYYLSWSPDHLNITPYKISFTFEYKGWYLNMDEDSIDRKITEEKKAIDGWITNVNNNISQSNAELRQNLQDFIQKRKIKLSEDEEKLRSLEKRIKINIKKKDSPYKPIDLKEKPFIRKIKPNPQQQEEYVLDEDKVRMIINVLNNQGRQFEKTPVTYNKLQEEDLRDILLVNLNSIFEGNATGETFSNKGKTDIYLKIDKGNILICECKIWKGKSVYDSTIAQLINYLTWRQNYGIIIMFVQNKNFTEVLSQMENIVQENGSYLFGYKKIADGHFSSTHQLAVDNQKQVKIHHLLYHIPN